MACRRANRGRPTIRMGTGGRNLHEFVVGTDPLKPTTEGLAATTVDVGGVVYPAVAFTRRQQLGGVTAEVLVSPGLDFATLLETVEVSATPRGDGLDDVVVRSSVPLAAQARQFFRLSATLPAN